MNETESSDLIHARLERDKSEQLARTLRRSFEAVRVRWQCLAANKFDELRLSALVICAVDTGSRKPRCGRAARGIRTRWPIRIDRKFTSILAARSRRAPTTPCRPEPRERRLRQFPPEGLSRRASRGDGRRLKYDTADHFVPLAFFFGTRTGDGEGGPIGQWRLAVSCRSWQ